jgi:hypothetical protein
MPRKLTQEFIDNYIIDKGWKNNSIYKNSQTKLELICPKNHQFKMSWHSFNRGYRCIDCVVYKTGEEHHLWKEDKIIKNILRRSFGKEWMIKNMKHDKNYEDFLSNINDYELDHIIPIYAFWKYLLIKDLIKYKNVMTYFRRKLVNNISNLQLLTLKEHNLKRNKYKEEDLEIYLNKFNINENIERLIQC